ncbi:MAG: aldolase/citrate lyase family protein [Desulforhabdus sp.]|jgi:4-hydroxy-2-oxoheptanedioate aldolase|nr:aldolase/citrate lyase family protein [Desulforhabdus sp.]
MAGGLAAGGKGWIKVTNPMWTKLNEGKVALGMITFGTEPNWIEIMAHAGLNFVKIDMMLTSIDWNDARHIVNAARAVGISTNIRLQSNPWAKAGNSTVGMDALRALAIGADGVYASLNTVDEIRELVSTGTDWHRKIHIIPFTASGYQDVKKEIIENTAVFPLIESMDAINNLEEIMSIEGLRLINLGISDLSVVHGHAFDYDHPAVWKLIDRAVKLGEKHKVIVGCNTGYAYRTFESVAKRVKALCEHGVRMITIQTPEFLLQTALHLLKEAIKKEVPKDIF